MYDAVEDDNSAANEEDNGNTIHDSAREHVERVEAEVVHRSQIIARDRDADKHVHDDIVLHEMQCIELLLQTMRIVQQCWKHLYDKDEHYRLQRAIIDQLKSNSSIN